MSKRPFNTNPREDANAAGIDRAVFPPWRASAEPVRTRAAFHGSRAGLLTVPKYGGGLVGPHELQQLFNDSDEEVLWLIVGAPEEIRVFARFKIQHRLAVVLFGGSDATAKGNSPAWNGHQRELSSEELAKSAYTKRNYSGFGHTS